MVPHLPHKSHSLIRSAAEAIVFVNTNKKRRPLCASGTVHTKLQHAYRSSRLILKRNANCANLSNLIEDS